MEAYDDTVCEMCGLKLHSPPREGLPEWDGFCCDKCQQEYEAGVRRRLVVVRPLFEFLSNELGTYKPGGWSKAIYKGTNCGAWLSIKDKDIIQIGSIVEGVDECAHTQELVWPFDSADFWNAVNRVEDDCSRIWNETHGCDTCRAFFGVAEFELSPVWHECPECDGDGVPI